MIACEVTVHATGGVLERAISMERVTLPIFVNVQSVADIYIYTLALTFLQSLPCLYIYPAASYIYVGITVSLSIARGRIRIRVRAAPIR